MPPRGGGGGARGGGGGVGFGVWGGPWWGGDYYDCVRDPYAPWQCLPPYALWGDDAAAPAPPAKPSILSSRAVQLGLAAAAGYFLGKGRLF